MQRPAAPTSIAGARHRQIACDTSEFEAISSMARQVTHYEDQILHLQAASATAIEQRDAWKQRAQEAEARLASGATPVSSAANSQYVALKRRLARMLHPDSPEASAESKSEREAIFVEIWTAIEQLEKFPDANC
ncbi:MAG TPA: hypothetical protein VHO91_08045 [Rhodopila sp.]|nr:hypothetical protein [Rhodopila sp.]